MVKIILVFLSVIAVIVEIAEFLAVPALFVIIGLLNHFGTTYYVVVIVGYLALYAICELVAHLICKWLDKKYSPLFERKLNAIANNLNKLFSHDKT